MKVLAFGEILWDVIDGHEHLGGAPFNFAAHSAQCGNESYIVSRLGTDPRGVRAFQQFKTHRVNPRFVQWDEGHATGTVDVTLTNGQPDYIIHENVAYDFIDPHHVLTFLNDPRVDVFYFGSLVQRKDVSARALDVLLESLKARYIFYDVNLRKHCFTEGIIRKSLDACNVFKLNNEELPVISKMLMGEDLPMEKFIESLMVEHPKIKTVIVTAADKGCYVFEKSKPMTHVAGVPVKVADAVGAGDAFSAAFMHMLGRYGDALRAAQVANKVGAFVASKHGPIPMYSPDITALLNGSDVV
ncbi:MAG TPA: carbohydrate kinase [Chryseosolibacter sp.]